jgi:hypothetical protein
LEEVEEEKVECQVCGKEILGTGYCSLHDKAHRNLVEKYERWKQALGISWEDYLVEVARNPLTGVRAKEVAEALSSAKQ